MSLRFKILIVVAVVLLGTMGVYLQLATRLITRDKLATLYDLNRSLAETVAEEVGSSLAALRDKLEYFATEQLHAPSDDPDLPARGLFGADEDLLAIEVYRPALDGMPERAYRFTREERLGEMGLAPADLDRVAAQRPVPIAAVRAEGMRVDNVSLPPDAALLRVTIARGEEAVAAVLRPDRLLRIMGRPSLYTLYLVDDRGTVLVHPDAGYVIGGMSLAAVPIVRDAMQGRVALAVREYRGEKGPRVGAFARVPDARGAVIVEVPRAEVERAATLLVRQSMWFAVAIVLVALLAGVFFSRQLTAPLRRLEGAARDIGAGRLDVRVDARGRDEIGSLARTFNGMADSLRETRAQLVHSSRMAAFGQMGAGIAHEIKNPLTGIQGFAELARSSEGNPEVVAECLETVEREARRCREIIDNLLRFARPEPARRVAFDVNEVVRDAVRLARHPLGAKGVRVEEDLCDPPPLRGDPKQIEQVFLNFLLNAGDAMSARGGGRVRIESRVQDGAAVLRFSDTGPGIPPEIRERIFEPFFTTKEPGKGTGLGLSVSFAIVRDHGGTLEVESPPGTGATFLVRLPLAGEGAPPAAPASG